MSNLSRATLYTKFGPLSRRLSGPKGRESVGTQNERARRDARAGGDEHVLDAVDLVHRRAPHLAHAFGDAVHAVDVRLAELTPVRVDRKPAAELDIAVAEELLGAPPFAESELLQLGQHEGGEVVVDHGGLDVVGTEAGGVPELARHEPHLGEPRDRVPVVAGHHVLVLARALGRSVEDRWRMGQVARTFERRDDDRLRAVALLAAVEQVERLDDPARLLVLLERDRLFVEPRFRIRRRVLAVRYCDASEVLARGAVLVHIA